MAVLTNWDQSIDRVMNAVAAGTTDQTSGSVDMQGYEEVTFIAAFGALTATQVTSMRAQQSQDDSSFADLLGTQVGPLADADGNKMLAIRLVKPAERYVRVIIDRATANAVIDGVIAIRSKPRVKPVTHSADVAFAETHVSPAEGTP